MTIAMSMAMAMSMSMSKTPYRVLRLSCLVLVCSVVLEPEARAESFRVSGPAAYPPAVGEQHPDFAALDQDGHPFSLAAEQGRVVLLHWCTLWCGPCQQSAMQEAELTAELDARIGPTGWVLVDALMEDLSGAPANQTHAQLWRQELSTPARTIHPDGSADAEMHRLGEQIETIPRYIVIGPDGVVTGSVEGFDAGTIDLLIQLVRDTAGPPVFIDGFEL